MSVGRFGALPDRVFDEFDSVAQPFFEDVGGELGRQLVAAQLLLAQTLGGVRRRRAHQSAAPAKSRARPLKTPRRAPTTAAGAADASASQSAEPRPRRHREALGRIERQTAIDDFDQHAIDAGTARWAVGAGIARMRSRYILSRWWRLYGLFQFVAQRTNPAAAARQ